MDRKSIGFKTEAQLKTESEREEQSKLQQKLKNELEQANLEFNMVDEDIDPEKHNILRLKIEGLEYQLGIKQ